jgi:hypothetical protein
LALVGGAATFGRGSTAAADDGAPTEAAVPALELTALAGVGAPRCGPGTCDGTFDTGVSIAGSALIRATRRWAFGISAEATRAAWHDTLTTSFGLTQTLSSTVTNGLVGPSARFTALPELAASPIVELGTGVQFQTETRTDNRCGDGVNPGASLGVGARVRLPPVALLAVGAATLAVPFQGCALADGMPPTPYAILTLGIRLGVAVDLGLRAGGAS